MDKDAEEADEAFNASMDEEPIGQAELAAFLLAALAVCAVCGEEESANPAWSGTHKYGPVDHIFEPI